QKLTPRARYKGQVKWFNGQKGEGVIRSEQGVEVNVRRNDIEADKSLGVGQPVSFEILTRGELSIAVRVRAEMRPQSTGRIVRFDEERGFGFIAGGASGDVFVHRSDVMDGTQPHVGDQVTFQVMQTEKGFQAVNVRLQECPHVL